MDFTEIIILLVAVATAFVLGLTVSAQQYHRRSDERSRRAYKRGFLAGQQQRPLNG